MKVYPWTQRTWWLLEGLLSGSVAGGLLFGAGVTAWACVAFGIVAMNLFANNAHLGWLTEDETPEELTACRLDADECPAKDACEKAWDAKRDGPCPPCPHTKR